MDRYDRQIAELTEHPERIPRQWMCARGLFKMVGKHNDRGCLTMIRGDKGTEFTAPTEELTAAIRKDKRIPTDIKYVKVRHLPIFAEWQRRLDKELPRKHKNPF